MVAEPLEWRKYDDAELPRVLEAALEAFAKHGYHGTSIRELAALAGLSVPGLYHHYPSKQDILVALLDEVMRDLVHRTAAAMEEAGESSAARFDAWVECLLRFHMFRTDHAFVTSSELRSLEGPNRPQIIAHRDELQRMLDEVVEAGAADGTFATPYPKAASRGVTVLCIGVSSWYRPDGPLTPDELVHRHLVLARGVVNATE